MWHMARARTHGASETCASAELLAGINSGGGRHGLRVWEAGCKCALGGGITFGNHAARNSAYWQMQVGVWEEEPRRVYSWLVAELAVTSHPQPSAVLDTGTAAPAAIVPRLLCCGVLFLKLAWGWQWPGANSRRPFVRECQRKFRHCNWH